MISAQRARAVGVVSPHQIEAVCSGHGIHTLQSQWTEACVEELNVTRILNTVCVRFFGDFFRNQSINQSMSLLFFIKGQVMGAGENTTRLNGTL